MMICHPHAKSLALHFIFNRKEEPYGVYTSGENLTVKKAQCACTITAQLGKKNRTSVDLYKDGLISSQIAETACDFVTNLEANYLQKDSKEYLTGKWFGNVPSSKRSDGASGDFTVMKISDSINVDVNSYFPKLGKLIEKENPGDTAYMHHPNPKSFNEKPLMETQSLGLALPIDKTEKFIFQALDIQSLSRVFAINKASCQRI